jgi:hypothetical protein
VTKVAVAGQPLVAARGQIPMAANRSLRAANAQSLAAGELQSPKPSPVVIEIQQTLGGPLAIKSGSDDEPVESGEPGRAIVHTPHR